MNSSSGLPLPQMLPDQANTPDLRGPSIVENGPQMNTSMGIDSDMICARCKARRSGRNLVVCFDGTSNQFGENNTNVVELYHRIIKDDDDKQLTYYNSGIGTYARPSWRSIKYLKQVLTNKIDLAIAWNFETILLKGYRWLADHYKSGDQIFLFGFSRGAYQVRALAAMIEKVGLILPGNEEQIPFAYELYADLKSHKKKPTKASTETFDMASRFKETFSRKDVKVHFVGNWDAVSSIGLVRGKTLPEVDKYEHICYFRHALALDERRVKFLPEYICGGESTLKGTSSQKAVHADNAINGVQDTQLRAQYSNTNAALTTDVVPKSTVPRVKEVWFSGSHSDIGGGTVSNTELNNAAIPVLWMGNEALMAGLKLTPSEVEWDWEKLRTSTPTNSLSLTWRVLEFLPLVRLNYAERKTTTWWPHLARGRVIKPGQKIHASVAFVELYKPKATFAAGMTEKNWSEIVGKGHYNSFNWVSHLGDLLEMDLFDLSAASDLFKRLKSAELRQDISGRLRFISLSDEGARQIMAADPDLEILLRMFRSDIAQIRIDGREILAALCGYDFSFLAMENLVNSVDLSVFPKWGQGNSEETLRESISVANLLRKLCKHPRPWDDKISVGFDTIMAMGRMAAIEEPRVGLIAFKALKCVCGRARRTDVVLLDEINRFTAARDEALQIAGAWMINMFTQSTEFQIISKDDVFSRIISMLRSKSYPVKASAAHLLANLGSDDAVLMDTSTDEHVALLCELLINDPLEWTVGILRVFEAFTRRPMFRQALSGMLVVHLERMLKKEYSPAPNMAGKLLRIFSVYSEFERIVSDILPQLETMLLSDLSDVRAMASKLLVDISRHRNMRSATLTNSIVQTLDNILEKEYFHSPTEVVMAFAEITQYNEFQPVTSEIVRQIITRLKDGGKFETVRQIFIEMSKHKEVRSTVLQTHGDIFQLLTNTRQSISQKVFACTLLEGILQYEEFRLAILKADVMPFLSSMLRSGEEELEGEAAHVLSNFLIYDELRVAMVPAEFVPQLLTMLQKVARRIILNERRGVMTSWSWAWTRIQTRARARAWVWQRAWLWRKSSFRMSRAWEQARTRETTRLLTRIRARSRLHLRARVRARSRAWMTLGAWIFWRPWARPWGRLREIRGEIHESKISWLPAVRTTPTESECRLPKWMRRFIKSLPVYARVSLLGKIGNGTHEYIMPWPPGPGVSPLPRLDGLLGSMMQWEGPDRDGLRRLWLARQVLSRRRNQADSRAGLVLGAMYQYDEFRPAILEAEVVPLLLRMWQYSQGGLVSVVTESLSKFYEYDEFRAIIPSTEIVNQIIDLFRFYGSGLYDKLNVLRKLTKYHECREVMLRRKMLSKLPATIKYAEPSEARIAVDLLKECAQYDGFWTAEPPSDIASCLASCVSVIDDGHHIDENGYGSDERPEKWSQLVGDLEKITAEHEASLGEPITSGRLEGGISLVGNHVAYEFSWRELIIGGLHR